jgi:hypothetical protein
MTTNEIQKAWSAHTRISRKTRTYESDGCLFTITTVCDSDTCDLCDMYAYEAAMEGAEGPVSLGRNGHGATVRIRPAG